MKKFYILLLSLTVFTSSIWSIDGGENKDLNKSGTMEEFYLRPGDKTDPEPWYAWIGGMDEITPVQLFTDFPDEEILLVEFFFSYGYAPDDWILFDIDEQGFSYYAPGPNEQFPELADGWCGYLSHDQIIPDEGPLFFKANVITHNSGIFEVLSEYSLMYDPMPPSAIELSIEDGYVTDEDFVTLTINPQFNNLDYVYLQVSEKPEEFQKDMPTASQGDFTSCGPYSLAICLKYFANKGYVGIDGGYPIDVLADSLRKYVKYDSVKGTSDVDLANGAKDWLKKMNKNFTVTGPKKYEKFNSTTMRNKTEGDSIFNGVAQNIIPLFVWRGPNANGDTVEICHFMPISSVHNTPVNGKRRFDFSDPQRNKRVYGDINENDGSCSGFDDNIPPTNGKIYSSVMICPKEAAPVPTSGGTTLPGPIPPPHDIPLSDSGKTIIRTRAVNTNGHKSERDVVITRVPRSSCPDTIVGVGGLPFVPQGAHPPGGTFGGPYFQDSLFFPVDTGYYPVTYSYTYENGFTSVGNFIIRVVEFDFGDAPDDPYPTLLASDGARHAIDGFTFLGNLVDGEPNGQPNANATGDDFNNLFDEDGVTFITPMVVGSVAHIRVQASVSGYLSAWIDFNQNGNWGDPEDHIFAGQLLSAGYNALSFNIPSASKAGETYMRFRFSSSGGLNFYGVAEDGEVEDYKTTIYPEGWDYTPTGSSHIISIPSNITLNCISMNPGDFLGVFYLDENGIEACGGAAYWDGINNKTVVAFGDDITTTQKEGFAEGEDFIWKLYDGSAETENEIFVTYDPNFPQADGKFHDNGISAIQQIIEKLEVDALADPMSICVGESVQLQASINHNCGNPQFFWTSSPSGFTSSEQNPSDSPEVTTTYSIAVFNSFGDAASASITVVVFPLPQVTCPEDFTVCDDTDPFLLSGATPAGGVYTGFGVILSGSDFIFDPSVAGEGDHIITYTYTDPQTNCEGSCTFVITVIEVVVICPEGFSVCLDDDPVTLSGGMPVGGTYSGPGVSGGNFDPMAAGVGTHSITYTYVESGTNCSASCIFTIEVLPLPQMDCPPNMTACEDDPIVLLNSSYPLGGIYTGTGVVVVDDNFYFDPAIGAGTYPVTYCYTDTITGCEGCCEFDFIVYEKPSVTCPEDFAICLDTDPFLLSGATPAGGVYTGVGVIHSGSDFIFDPSIAGEGDHIITYTYVDPQTNCEGFCTFVITVIEVEVICPENIEMCIDAGSKVLTGGTPAGGTYSGPGVQFGAIFYPSQAGVGNHVITYSYTIPGTNCTASCEFIISVYPLPQVDCPADMEVCYLSPTILLINATPLGGTYSGEGIFMESGFYYFDPSVGVGLYEIEYCYSDVNGCDNCCTFNIKVIADQIVEIPTGWSGISSYINPDNPDFNTLLYPLTYPLIILSNFNGVYWPGGNTYTIENWDIYSGYVIKSEWDTQLPFCGEEIQDKKVVLYQGWNLMPVLSSAEHDIELLFEGIEEVLLVKEVAGTGIYWKEFGINTIGNVIPGKAYYVKMTAEASVIFDSKSKSSESKSSKLQVETPWNPVNFTPGSHVTVFNLIDSPLQSGDIIGGFTNSGICAGAFIIESDKAPFAINLNAKDVLTTTNDGFEEGEKMNFMLYRESTKQMHEMQVTYNPEKNSGLFETHGISEITNLKLSSMGINGKLSDQLRIYPNPSTGVFKIDGIEIPSMITITDTFGKIVLTDHCSLPKSIDLTEHPSGVYFIQIETSDETVVRKLIVR
jgi:hypothetical protein